MGAPEFITRSALQSHVAIQPLLDIYAERTDVDMGVFGSTIIRGVAPTCFSAELSNHAYHQCQTFASNTGLTHILRSEKHFLNYMNPDKETKDSSPNIGTAVHARTLELDAFFDRYAVWNGKDRRAKGYKDFKEDNKNKIVLTEKELVQVCSCAKSVMDFKDWDIGKAIKSKQGKKEFSVFWIDEETGVPCRARLDLNYPTFSFDLKTCGDARRQAVKRQISDQHYDLQVAMYSEAIRQFTGEDRPFWLGFVEIDAPYEFAPHLMGETIMDSGRNKFRKALRRFKRVMETGEFPGYRVNTAPLEFSAYQMFVDDGVDD